MSLFLIKTGYLLLSALCLLAVFWGLSIALRRTEANPMYRRKIKLQFTAVLAGWIGIVSVISLSGYIQDFGAMPPRLFPFLLVPLLLLVWLLRRKRTLVLLKAIPPQWFLYIQVFRIPVELFLWQQFILRLTPIQMTLEGQNLDILVGISGPLVGALLTYTRKQWAIATALVWNVLGLCLLLNIVVIAILSFPSPMRTFMNEPANTLITEFPIVFLPLLLVPLAYYMHAFSIRQLWMLYKRTDLQPQTNPLQPQSHTPIQKAEVAEN